MDGQNFENENNVTVDTTATEVSSAAETVQETPVTEQPVNNYQEFNSHPRFPFCKRVSHFESDLQILYSTFHFCNDFPVFSLAFMI